MSKTCVSCSQELDCCVVDGVEKCGEVIGLDIIAVAGTEISPMRRTTRMAREEEL